MPDPRESAENDALQCRWFGGTANPEENADCQRPARNREYGLVLCDLHYEAAHADPEDWTDEMNRRSRVIPPRSDQEAHYG